ncbi:hypothetical protein Poly51_40520 [Rubripirellula tenax]|uniref:Uncharacterized protein n=1 Tax=Rubripirellula tenax TaxID=2528015 RepID=A0A5C6ETG5_9BACT|nr:hypothetical protein [Rubripirellula tenax]TWU50759.1 hypothetical protein Poly51_40520 [Rubripirellula tenax]
MASWIARHIERAISQTADGFGDWCVNLQSTAGADRWAQITWEHINLAYPSADDPASALASLPDVPLLDIASWEPNTFVTFSHGADGSLPALADFMAAYFVHVLRLTDAESDWSVSEEAL